MKYAVYLRKSRADDPHEPLEETLRKHREQLTAYMLREGISVLPEDVYEEVVSGDSLYARPQMLRLLEKVESGEYAGVLCMDIQRLGRGSMRDQGIILDAFKYSGTKILTPVKTYDLRDDTDETYTEFETFLGRQELKMIKKRLRRGIEATIQKGGYIANAPYGYEKTKIGKLPTLKINEEEARFVRMMFDLYLKGMGGQQIAEAVTRMGARPHRGEEFNRTSILKILKSPTYIGKIVWNQKTCLRPGSRGNEKHKTIYHPPEEWTIVDGVHPAIIDEDIWNRVQVILRGRYHSPSFTGVIENPLAGLMICGNCGMHMQRQASAKGGPLLLCQKKGCIVSSRLDLVEKALLSSIREEMEKLSAESDGTGNQAEDHTLEMARSLEKDIRTARQQESRLHDLLEQGVYDTATFMARHNVLQERIEKLESARSQLHPPRKKDVKAMQERILRVLADYPTSSPAERNQLLKSILEKAVYTKSKGAKPAEFHLKAVLLPIYL